MAGASLFNQEPVAVYEGMADTFNQETEVGVIFNAYDYLEGSEVVYMNNRAFHLTGKEIGKIKGGLGFDMSQSIQRR